MKEKNKKEVYQIVDNVIGGKTERIHLLVDSRLSHPMFMSKIANLIRDHVETMIKYHISQFHDKGPYAEEDIPRTRKDDIPRTREEDVPRARERTYTKNDMIAFGEYMAGRPLTDTPVGSILEYWQTGKA